MRKLYFTAFTIIMFGLAGNTSAKEADVIQTIDSLKAEITVTVAGTVEKIRDEDEFILKDDTGSIKVWIGPNRMPVEQGDQVTVKGLFDRGIIRHEIYADAITDSEGNVTKLEKRYE